MHPQKSPQKLQEKKIGHYLLTHVIDCPMKIILKNKEIQHQGLNSKLSTSVEVLRDKQCIQLK